MSKILVVDDEAIITMQLEERLTAMGYTVAGMAASGEEAIEKARRLLPDIVLMDIVMPGKMNGIEAAKIIGEELNLPVVFITSYADDAIIEKAKNARPYGYVLKPFNELEIKAAIEIALFRKTTERDERLAKRGEKLKAAPVTGTGEVPGEQMEYLDLPEIKTVLLKDIFTDIVLFLYTENAAKEPVFKFALEEGIKKGGRNLFAYFSSTVQKYFLKEIQKEELFTHRMKKTEVFGMKPILERCMETLPGPGAPRNLQILLDFSETDEFSDIAAIRNLILEKKAGGFPVSGIIALNIGKLDHTLIQSLAAGISKIIVSTGRETTLSFAHHTFPAESISVVSQKTLDDVVKKMLEPVVLSLLEKPISGYDIVAEIHNRFKVLIPQARIYAILYDLQQQGYLVMKASGKSKLYSPTEKGRDHIHQKLNEYKTVFRHILGEEIPEKPGSMPKG
jgi:CheY-like chemotaxis protein/DNA-binding PadR family transcriptional regulator